MNAKEKMKEIVRVRGWHGITNDKPAQRAAAVDKALILSGKLSYEKCCEWLERLGYVKIQDEQWQKNKQ